MKKRFNELVSIYLDSSLSASEETELYNILSKSDECKKSFLKLSVLDEMMSQAYHPNCKEDSGITNININLDNRTFNENIHVKQKWGRRKWGIIIVAICCIISLFLIFYKIYYRDRKCYMTIKEQNKMNYDFESNAYPSFIEFGKIVADAPLKKNSNYSLQSQKYEEEYNLNGISFSVENGYIFSINDKSYLKFSYWLPKYTSGFTCWIDTIDSDDTYSVEIPNVVYEKWTKVRIPFNTFSVDSDSNILIFDKNKNRKVTWFGIGVEGKPDIKFYIDDLKFFTK